VKIIDLARKNDESSWLVYTERDIKYRLCVWGRQKNFTKSC
jgi:quinolinate synthase